ncbi:hypothetical protein [Sutcliffiella horikoshii]|uniref:hypothetical protein n=1 Tax=Sutcliffiella horikoshii TaxID=79883 RepID=UPI001F2E0815|nr:hypothetical protein [Sutcliffiella horikoshii]MCG1020830.1 hypothetical protein [Sutcliffiella horikoshii]
MKSFALVLWNVLSGLYVLLFSLWLAGPGIAETETPTYNLWYLLFFVVWLIGLTLQFKRPLRKIGISTTLLPFMFYLVLTVQAITI